MLVYNKKIRDSTPEIRPAGKLITPGHSAQDCFSIGSSKEDVPDIVRRMRGVSNPDPGARKDIRRRSGDPPVDHELSHGVKTKSSLQASHLINPSPMTRFEQVVLDQSESDYISKTKPLGTLHDQTSNLPRGVDPIQTRFGILTIKDESVAEAVSPQKSAKQIEEEHHQGRHLYRKSHNDWDVGEKVDRDYDWSKFKKTSLYGVETPHDNSGQQVNSALHWLKSDDGKVVSKRLDDFREKTQPQIGQVHDPIVDSMAVPSDHTFGIIVPVDELNAGELLHKEPPTTFSECLSFDKGMLSTIRSHLKNHHYYEFPCLFDALRHLDKDKTGVVSVMAVRDIFSKFSVPLHSDMLEMLLRWCDTPPEGVVYEDLVMLLNWKQPLNEEISERLKNKKRDVLNLEPPSPLSPYQTSSQAYRAVVGEGGTPTRNYRTYGVPTIRSDLPAPRIKRVADTSNYGDEADSYGLMYPSIYSNHGVYEVDFFKPHPPDKIRRTFENIGVVIPNEVFQELWEKAAEKDPKGQVSVESFRSIMEEMLADVSNE